MTAPTWPELRAFWDERDRRYSNGVRLTPEQEAIVRAGRASEVERLPRPERAQAWFELAKWAPPHVMRRRP